MSNYSYFMHRERLVAAYYLGCGFIIIMLHDGLFLRSLKGNIKNRKACLFREVVIDVSVSTDSLYLIEMSLLGCVRTRNMHIYNVTWLIGCGNVLKGNCVTLSVWPILWCSVAVLITMLVINLFSNANRLKWDLIL